MPGLDRQISPNTATGWLTSDWNLAESFLNPEFTTSSITAGTDRQERYRPLIVLEGLNLVGTLTIDYSMVYELNGSEGVVPLSVALAEQSPVCLTGAALGSWVTIGGGDSISFSRGYNTADGDHGIGGQFDAICLSPAVDGVPGGCAQWFDDPLNVGSAWSAAWPNNYPDPGGKIF